MQTRLFIFGQIYIQPIQKENKPQSTRDHVFHGIIIILSQVYCCKYSFEYWNFYAEHLVFSRLVRAKITQF